MLTEYDTRPRTGRDEPLDLAGVAALCRCSESHIRNQVRRGRFPAPAKIGVLSRWDRAVVLRWIADGTGRAGERTGPTVERAGTTVQVR